MKRLGLFLLVILLLPFSIILNAISAVVWSLDGKPNDVNDDNVEGRSWEGGMKDYFGWIAPPVMKALAGLREEPGRWNHHLKGLLHAWIREYPKRASKLASLALALIVVWLLARPWIVGLWERLG